MEEKQHEGGQMILGNRFSDLRPHRRGATCSIDLATDRVLNRSVAVKRALSARNSPELQARLGKEAAILASASHPNVVAIHDLVHYSTPGGEAAALVLEFLRGGSLYELVTRSKQPVLLETALSLLVQAAWGLQAIHRTGYVHRDVNPSNLFVSRTTTGRLLLKVIDLGLARPHLTDSRLLAEAGPSFGAADYVAPECLRGHHDASSDLYALCASAAFALIGRPVHNDFQGVAFLDALRRARPSLNEFLGVVLLAGLSESAQDRPSLAELAAAFAVAARKSRPTGREDAPTVPVARMALPPPPPACAQVHDPFAAVDTSPEETDTLRPHNTEAGATDNRRPGPPPLPRNMLAQTLRSLEESECAQAKTPVPTGGTGVHQ